MTIPSDIGAAARVRAPEVYERGRAHVSRIQFRNGNDAVVPTSVSFTLYGQDGASLHTGTPTESGGLFSVTVPDTALPSTLGFGAAYMEEWTGTVGGRVQIWRRDAWLARRALHCPVTQEDLQQAHPLVGERVRSGTASVQPMIDMAWGDTLIRLNQGGRWPAAIVEPSSLVPYVRARALAAVFRSLIQASSAPDSPTERLAVYYDGQAEVEWARIAYLADTDQDGVADSTTERRGAGGIYARSTPPTWTAYRPRVL